MPALEWPQAPNFLVFRGFRSPKKSPLLVSIRKAMTTIMGNGYNPDTLILTPATSEALDVLVSGISGGVNDYVFPPASLAPNNIFGLNKRVSKTIAAPAVVDSRALGKLYTSPVTLARFEADSGTTNRGNVRMEPQRGLWWRAHRRGREDRRLVMAERKPKPKSRPKQKPKLKREPPPVLGRVARAARRGR